MNGQNYSFSGSYHPINPQQNFWFSTPLDAIWKTVKIEITRVQNIAHTVCKCTPADLFCASSFWKLYKVLCADKILIDIIYNLDQIYLINISYLFVLDNFCLFENANELTHVNTWLHSQKFKSNLKAAIWSRSIWYLEHSENLSKIRWKRLAAKFIFRCRSQALPKLKSFIVIFQ